MKITKKRLLKLGARDYSDKAVALTLNNDYWIYWETGTCTTELWFNGEKAQIDRIKKFQDLIVSLNMWGVPSSIFPEFPKKRSLKKDVKVLKKKLKEVTTNNELLQKRVEDLEVVLEEIKGDLPCTPTSVENAEDMPCYRLKRIKSPIE